MEEGAVIKHDIKKAPKTGDWGIEFPEVSEKCIACGTCVSFCPEAAIEVKKQKSSGKKIAKIDFDFCKGCGVCARICPVKAIMMTNKNGFIFGEKK